MKIAIIEEGEIEEIIIEFLNIKGYKVENVEWMGKELRTHHINNGLYSSIEVDCYNAITDKGILNFRHDYKNNELFMI